MVISIGGIWYVYNKATGMADEVMPPEVRARFMIEQGVHPDDFAQIPGVTPSLVEYYRGEWEKAEREVGPGEHDAGTGPGRSERCRNTGGAATHNEHIRVGEGLVVSVGIAASR